MANPWEQDWEPQGQQSTGAPWEQDYDLKDDPAKRALPDGVQPSTVAGGRGNVNPEPVRQMPAGLKPTEYGLSDVQPTVTASTGQAVQPEARKRKSVLEDYPASRPWDMRSTIKARADIEAMPQARPEASMQETPLPTQIGMDLRNSVTNPAARGVVAGLAGLGTVIPGAIQAGADLLGADGVGDYAGRVARTGEQITSPMRPNAGGEKLAFDIANSITQTAPTLIVGLGGGPAMAALFGQSAAQEYTQGRSAGLDGGRAAARAGIMAGAEVLGERFGFSEQLKILKGLANRVPAEELAPVFARQIMKEIPGEQLTTLIQFLGDKVGPGAMNPEATLADYLQQAGDTLKVTIGQTAVMGGAPVAINAARQHLKKPVDRTPQIKALRAQGDEVAAAHMEQRAQKEQAAYSADVEAGALANFSPELAQRYRETRITGAKMGDAVVQTAARWNFEQAAQVAGLTPKAQQAIADAITQLPPEKVPGFVQKAITGLVEAGVAQPFDGMDQIAANIEAQRDQMLDSVLGAMDDINQLEAQQDGAQDTADATTVQAPDAGAPQALGAEQGAGEGPGIAESALPDGRTEQEQALTGEWQQFPQETETMGVPRAEMPQVKTVHRGPLVNFLGARGVTSEQVEVDPADLKPTQAEFSQTKVQEAADRDTDRSILISSDGYIIDGHHQAIAKLQNGKPVRAIRLGAPAADLLPLVREFPSSTTDQSSDEQNATQPSGNAGQVAQAQAVEAPAPARGDGAAAAGVPAAPGAGDVQADGVVATVPEDRFGNMPDVSKNTPNLNTSAEPAQKTAESEQVELLGRNSQPMSEGAKPFKTQAEAKKEKKLHPTMRVVKSKDGKGYVLAPKTAKQIAAMERAAKNIKGVSTGEAGPQSLHHFILSQGGLAFESMADAGFDKNQRIGNRWLFSKTGKTLAKMSEALKDAGFITEETENAVSEGLRRSLVNPVYTSDGYEAMARAEAETRFEDHLAAQQEAPEAVDENADGFDPFASGSTLVDLDFVPDDIKATGYDEAELQKRQEFAALLAAAEAEGIDVDSIQELAYENARNGTDDDYRNEARAFIAAARSSRAQAAERSSAQQGRTDAERRSGGDVREGNGQESATQDAGAGQSLTQQPDGTLAVTGNPDALKQRLTDAGIPAKSVLKSKTGVVVGKTQAARARNVLEGRDADKAAPRTLDESGRATDGQPINAGDVFTTLSGRETTPYPKQKGERYASQWLIDNAIAEARARGEDFNATGFGTEKPLKDGSLTTAGRESMLMYLFGEQPAVKPSILKPLVREKQEAGAQSAVTEEILEDLGLLRYVGGRWKYKFSMDGTMFTANSKEDAVERATEAYNKTPPDQRLTSEQRAEKADAELIKELDRVYGGMSLPQLRARFEKIGGDIASLQAAGANEFTGNGGRRTRAATSNEAARAAGEERLRLGIYIKHREALDAEKPARTRITQDTAADMKPGDVVVDGKGVEYIALGARHKWLEVAPIVNGKANVSADTTFKFHLDPDTDSGYEGRRSDPIYKTGKNLYGDAKKPGTVPPAVADSVKWALGRLKEVESMLAGVERARGRGHVLAMEWQDQQEKIAPARKKLDEFKRLAAGNGVDAAAFIKEMGGEPDLERFNVTPVKAEPKPPAPKTPPKVTPQIPSSRQLVDMIKVAADSIEQLRRPDVDRVLSEAPAHFRQALAMHISQKRPDLADEVREVMDEMATKQAAQDKPKAEKKPDRADYFSPGNVVKSYIGFDEVLEYRETDSGGFSVRVHEVRKINGEWVRVGKPQDARVHSTQPEAKNLKDGPVERLQFTAAQYVKYTEARADGKPFTNAPDRGAKPADETPALTAPTKADIEAQQARAEQAARDKAAADRAAERTAAQEEERKRIAKASEQAADTFELGGDAMANLTGQQDIFGSAESKPDQETKAKAGTTADDFVPSPTGEVDYGEITPEMGKAIRRQAGKIRLQQGNERFGLAHIEQRHGEEIRSAGFASVQEFVADIAKNIDQVWKPDATSQLVALHVVKNDRVMFVQLQAASDGTQDFYTVNTAFPSRAGYVSNKKNWKMLWEGRAQPSQPVTSEQAPFAESPQEAGKATTIPAGQSGSSVAQANSDMQRQKAADDLKAALGDLGDIFGKNFRSNIVPEQEQKLLPVLSRVMDAAFRLGYLKFKDAAKFTLDKIREALGADVADAITIDHLQGAYIAMAGKYKDQGADTKKAVVNVEDKAEIEAHTARADNPADQENRNAASPNERVERDRGEPAAVPAVGNAVPGDARDTAGAAGEAGGQAADGQGSGQPRLARIQADGTTAGRERGDQRVPDRVRQAGIEEFDAGADIRERGGDAGVDGVQASAIPASEVAATAVRGDADLKARAKQREADKIPVKTGDIENIRATLPYLLEGQQDDVLKTEQRFAVPDGYGMLFTNGTGTGKTFTGLGVVKRFARQGKTSALIVVPDDKISSDWVVSARALDLTITRLESTKDAGRGISITTYANLGDNDALATRQWDLVVADEAHTLMQSADGKMTGYLENLRAITHHPDGAFQRYTMLNRSDIDRLASISERIDANNKILNNQDTMDAMMTATRAENEKLQAQADKLAKKLREALDAVREEVKAQQGAKRTRAVFLSATPFAYEKTIDWANGYLFDYNEGREDEAKRPRSYNEGTNREQFFMQHFGYTMRYNKLNSPDPRKVDTGLMQRQFNSWLKKRGALSGRMLDVKADYDRRFVLVESAVGNQIDSAIEWIEQRRRAHYEQHKDKKGNDTPPNGYDMLQSNLNDTLYGPQGHLLRRYLLEAIKAKEVVPIIKQHMAMGRKVVVFHDFKKGGAINPFKFDRRADRTSEEVTGEEAASQLAKVRAYNAAAAEFNRTFPDLAGDELLSDLQSPIERFTREFKDVLLINGDEKKSDLLQRYKDFNDDAKGPTVALVQSAKNKGWSGHDTTGKHQRVLFNLGLPTQPTLSIQQEGRIYRTGQVSNALFRYLNTGTNWERWAFAQTIAERASAAENLGMGELSRALKDSFVSAFEESDTYPPGHEGEGTGGKERDKAANNTLSEWDRAKSFYWGTQKKNSKTKAQEGTDYFATPEPVGLKMVHWLRLRGGEDTLEPSGGHGAIARWLPDTGKRTVIEPSSALRSRLAMVMNPAEDRILDGEFEDLDIVNKFDGIAMNPPFGSGGKTAIEHVAKAATHLRDGGRIVALIPTGPAADKRFDQWFYETEQRPLKPAIKHPTLGDIYVGDTIKSRASWAATGVVTSVRPDGSAVLVKTPEGGAATMVTIQALTDVQPTGKRTREVRPAEGLHLVADIKLPQVTFERAGTKVATRIVVIEKQTDAARAPAQMGDRDLTDITDIGELFDRIEDIEMPARAMTKAQEEAAKAEETAPAAKPERAGRTPAAKPEKPAKAEVVPTVDRNGAEIVEHVTAKGKTIRGIIRKDLTKEQAQAIDPYTWKKDGGYFIRDKYLKPDDGGSVRFSQGLLAPASLGPKPTLDQVQRLVDKIQQVAKNVLPISVVSDPSQIAGLDVPVGTKPSGALIDGRVYLFADNLKSTGDAYVTLFHELFHLGLQKVIPAEDYAALLTQFAKDPLVQRYVMMWKESAEGRQKAGTMNAAAYDALAAEEALAMVSEELAASDNMGSRKLPELVKAVLSWMAKVADRVGMPASFSDWMRGLSRTDAEKFVSDMIRAAMGGPNNLARVRSKYGTQVQALSSQTRLSAVDAADRLAGLSPEARQVDMLAPNVWSAPEPTRTDRVIYELQDGRIDLKRVQEAIKEAGAAIPEKFDARLAETLYPGRVATRAQRFLDDEVKPLLEAMARNNVEMDELADYLHARGAKERNAQMAKVNPDLPDGGSGKNSKGVLMTNAAADAHLALISPTRKMALDAMARRVDAITKGTRQLLVAEGLEKQETIDAWEKAYKNYVPMFRDEAESGNPHPTGNGMSVRGSASKRATGSTKQVTNILAHVLMQREAAITRAEKNRVAVALYGLALSNPNRDFWTTIRPGMKPEKIAEELERMGVDPAVAVAGMSGAPTITTVDPTLGVKVSRPNPIYKSLPGAITVRINGEDRVLMLNTTDPRGARMAENLKNLDGLTAVDFSAGLLHTLVSAKIPKEISIGHATRWMASVNTQYNPAFGLVNLIRDTVGGSINLTSTPLRGKTLKVLALTAPALKGIALELSGRPSGEWGKLFRQFQADGGQTGFRDQFKDASERTKLIAAELKQFEKAGQLTPGKVAHKILDALDIFNTTLENAVRLAAYREGLLEGMSRPAAARLGRELTVDFNRKGRIGREAGPLYAFFNASVQGSARTIETLRGPAGQKIIAGGMMLGVMQAIMLLAAGYEDDEIPEFVKSRALIIPLPWMEGKQYLAIPLPLGLHVLPNTGRVLAELTLDGGRDAGGKLFNALGEIAGAFNPLGGGNVFTADGALKTLAPTVVDPVIELGFNRNFAGKPIEREKFGDNDQRPGFERAREGTQRQPTGQAYIEISRFINKLTGGDDYEAGKVSPTPEAVRYLAQVAGGGLLRETEKIINTTFDVARGEDVKPTGVPIFGRLYGEVDDESVQRARFYDNLRRIERAENVLNAAAKKGDLSRAEQVMADIPEVMLGKAARDAKSSVSKLNNAAAQTIGDREMSKALDEARTGVMRGLNEVAAEIDRPRREATVGAKLKQAIGLSDAR